jgi:hypothetical protein
MGPHSLNARSSTDRRYSISKLSFSDDEKPDLTAKFDSSDVDSSENESLPMDSGMIRWSPESLKIFSGVCENIGNDEEFDKLNNKLLIALKEFSSGNSIFCMKCIAMKMVTKRGKTNKTYQFNCGNHTISAAQILSTLPDEFILEHVPCNPMHVFHETIQWIGKDHLSPELEKASNFKNASKRFSVNRSPIKGLSQSSLLLRSRNQTNETLMEIKELRSRLNNSEQKMSEYSSKFNRVLMENDILNEQLKLIREENEIFKKYLSEKTDMKTDTPNNEKYALLNEQLKQLKEENASLKKYLASNSIGKPVSTQSTEKIKSTYSEVSGLIRPVKPKRQEKSALEIIGKYEYKTTRSRENNDEVTKETRAHDFSPLTLVFFEGCFKKSAGEYRGLLNKIGFEAHLARDISFIAEDIIQVTTFESEKKKLIEKLTSISSQVKYLDKFNPTVGISFAKYGKFTDDQAASAYYKLMEKNATRIETESRKSPSLKRTALFFKKLAATKNFELKPAERVKRIFCLGDFITELKPHDFADDKEVPCLTRQVSNESLPSVSQTVNTTRNEMEVDPEPSHAN